MPKPLKTREAVKRLRNFDPEIIYDPSEGKGSHASLERKLPNGKVVSTTITNHKGKDVSKGVLRSIIRKLQLPKNIFD